MAATFTETLARGSTPSEPLPVQVVAFTADDSYPATTGGYPITGLKGTLLGGPPVILSDGHMAIIDRDNAKVKIGEFADTTQVWTELGNGTDLTDVTGELLLFQY